MRRPPNRRLILLATAILVAAAGASLFRTPVAAQPAVSAAFLAKPLGGL
jgi:hypothetical protein